MKTQPGHSIASIVSFSAPALAFLVALTIGLVYGPTDTTHKTNGSQKEPSKTEQDADTKGVTDPKQGETQEEKS